MTIWYFVSHEPSSVPMHIVVKQGEDHTRRLLHPSDAPERPFPIVLQRLFSFRLKTVGVCVHAVVAADIRAAPVCQER
jgi:hypothetical protein